MLNTLALKESGIDKNFVVTGTGQIEKDASGEPTGDTVISVSTVNGSTSSMWPTSPITWMYGVRPTPTVPPTVGVTDGAVAMRSPPKP